MCIPLGRNTVGSFCGRTHCVLVPSEKYVLWYRHLESTMSYRRNEFGIKVAFYVM